MSCFADFLLKNRHSFTSYTQILYKNYICKKIAKGSTNSAQCYVMCHYNYFKSLWDFCTDLGFTTLVIPLCVTC